MFGGNSVGESSFWAIVGDLSTCTSIIIIVAGLQHLGDVSVTHRGPGRWSSPLQGGGLINASTGIVGIGAPTVTAQMPFYGVVEAMVNPSSRLHSPRLTRHGLSGTGIHSDHARPRLGTQVPNLIRLIRFSNLFLRPHNVDTTRQD